MFGTRITSFARFEICTVTVLFYYSLIHGLDAQKNKLIPGLVALDDDQTEGYVDLLHLYIGAVLLTLI